MFFTPNGISKNGFIKHTMNYMQCIFGYQFSLLYSTSLVPTTRQSFKRMFGYDCITKFTMHYSVLHDEPAIHGTLCTVCSAERGRSALAGHKVPGDILH